MIGSTRGSESPSRSFGWAIEGPMFKNSRPDHLYPWLDNCQECIDYWTIDTGIECPAPGAYWDCIQANPYQRHMYLGAKFTPINWIFEGPEGCCPRYGDLVDLWSMLGVTHGSCMDRLVKNTASQMHNTSIHRCNSSTRI